MFLTCAKGDILFINALSLGSPTLIVIKDDDPDTIDQAVGNIIVGRRVMNTPFSLQTMRTYLYITE